MKKKLMMLAVVLVTAVSASAQITWNAKAGVGAATCWTTEDGADLSPHVVAKAGVGIEKPLSTNLSLMPSLEVAWKGTDEGGYSVDFFYAQIPVLFAYRLHLADAWNMAIKAGPYAGYAFSKGEDNDHVNNFDAGVDVGLDFERHRFVFGVEAEWGLVPLIDGVGVYNLAFYATVGWKF